MNNVFVLDMNKQKLNPVHPGRARILLSSGRAAVYRRYPFTIILKCSAETVDVEPLRVKLDPGSQQTGMAVVNDVSGEVVFAAEIMHRGRAIKGRLDDRRAVRRNRRQRQTRYRQPRFNNRRRRNGWLPPSLESRISNVVTWVRRLLRVCPISAMSLELVKFDMQAMVHPEIAGVEYRRGTLYGYEVREYLLEKWNSSCTYCGIQNVPLQVEHIRPRAKGGTDGVSNLCLACVPCNKAKGTQDIHDFLAEQPELLKCVLTQAKASLKDAAAVNITRWELYHKLLALGLPIECGSGGRTKYNRTRRELPKTHWVDAACVGVSTPEHLHILGVVPLLITANGHGCRQMCAMDSTGFPRTSAKQAGRICGFQTGDIVRAVVTSGKKVGTYVGRVAVRANGSFNIKTKQGMMQGISHRFCTIVHHVDGYSYQKGGAAPPFW
jgi:5-methylcytosine-specific restriction endonuclease McrA